MLVVLAPEVQSEAMEAAAVLVIFLLAQLLEVAVVVEAMRHPLEVLEALEEITQEREEVPVVLAEMDKVMVVVINPEVVLVRPVIVV